VVVRWNFRFGEDPLTVKVLRRCIRFGFNKEKERKISCPLFPSPNDVDHSNGVVAGSSATAVAVLAEDPGRSAVVV
jgi:hypothetical protein